MFAVEEVGGVAGIKRKPLEAGKRLEPARCPLPTVAQQISDAESALALGERTDWSWVPVLEIEITLARVRSRSAPREGSLGTVFCSISHPMPLRFRGQRLPCPASVCARLGVAHIHRPVQRQRDFIKHGPAIPSFAIPLPKHRMANLLRGSPIPILFCPAGRILIATCGYEIEVLAVSHFIFVDCECRDVDGLCFVLVVPTENASVTARESKRCPPGGNLDHSWRHCWNNQFRLALHSKLPFKRQLVEHVRQGFPVHEPMLDGDIEQCLGGKICPDRISIPVRGC